MASKLDELDKDRKEKKKIINSLKGEVSYHSDKLRKMEKGTDVRSNTLEDIFYFSMALKKLKVKTLTILS